MGMESGLTDKGAVGDWIIQRKHLIEMRPRRRKSAGKHQVSTGGGVTQNEPGGIITLTAPKQRILVQTLRPIEFAADSVIERLPIGDPKELRGRTQPLPQLSSAGVGIACFRRRVAFDGH